MEIVGCVMGKDTERYEKAEDLVYDMEYYSKKECP
jgi:hypothetical protein